MMLVVGTISRVATLICGSTSLVVSYGTVRTLRGASVLGGVNGVMGAVLSGADLGGR